MRKGSVFVAIFCFVLSTMGCSNAFNDGRGNAGGGQDVTTPNPDLARVEIQLPPRAVAPFGVGLPDAREHTDFFQVFFRRTDGDSNFTYSATATTTPEGGSIQAFIPPGTYDILLLAGTALQGGIFGQPALLPGSSLRLLMASSSIRDREIVLDSVNEIHMVLGTLDVDITAPTQALAGQNFPVSVEISPNNPLLMEELRRSPRTVSVDFDRVSGLGDFSAPLTEVTDDLLRADLNIIAPSTPGNTTLLVWSFPFSLAPGSSWMLASVMIPAVSHIFTRDITIVSLPEVDIIITWPDGHNS